MSNLSIYEQTPANPTAAITTLRDLLEKQKGEIAKVLPKHLTPERMARIAVNAVSRDKKLMECSAISILKAVMQAGALGLEPGGPLGDSFLVAYRNRKENKTECQLIVGYRGLISLARRSGQVLSIEAHVVREKDEWSFRRDQDGTFFSHVPSEDADPGKIMRAYAVARLKDTPLPAIEIMSLRELDGIMHATQSHGDYGPWKDHHQEMCRKSVVRRLSKYLPMSVDFVDALAKEDEVEHGVPSSILDVSVTAQHVETLPGSEQPQLAAPKPKSALDKLVKQKAQAAAPAKPADQCAECEARNGDHAQSCSKWEPPITPDEIQGREPGMEG